MLNVGVYSQQAITQPYQEEKLVKYTIGLTGRGLLPTKEMIQCFASKVVKIEVENGWILEFVKRYKNTLITK
jgi:hypothetical protein